MATINLTELVQGSYPLAPGAKLPTTGTATIDFGLHPGSNEAVVAVTGQASIGSTSVVTVTVQSDDTTADHSAGDHAYFLTFAQLSTNTPTAGTGFNITARSHHKLTGTWTVRWSWI
jgi:hypothetical protein